MSDKEFGELLFEELKDEILALNKRIDKLEQKLEEHSNKEVR